MNPPLRFDKVPAALSSLHQWVLWKTELRGDKPTKVPYSVSGGMAKSNDPETWAPFEDAVDMYERGGYDGIGFMFREGGGIVGIDLDGCRDPAKNAGEEWAKEIVTRFNTYAEISPSRTGVKLFVFGKSPFEGGKKRGVEGAPEICGKSPAIEVYDKLRYFAVTGWSVGQSELQSRPDELLWLKSKFFPLPPPPAPSTFTAGEPSLIERARKYLTFVPGAISGQSGHNTTFRAACILVLGFGLGESEALALLSEWNLKCQPPWSEKELRHKVSQAGKQPGERGKLATQPYALLHLVKLPEYPAPPKEYAVKTLGDAMEECIAEVKKGKKKLVTIGMPELDKALDGGVDFGEYVIIAARPSHLKSAMALQGVHHWTEAGLPVLFISQEMPAVKLGERALQYVSDAPKEEWSKSAFQLAVETDNYKRDRAPCYIINDLSSAEDAATEIEKFVTTKGVRVIVVDYAQILKGKGRDEREQVSRTSTILRQIATTKMVLMIALCQLSRGVEQRGQKGGGFLPTMKDLKDSGQLEQDADVIVFQCWPYRLNPKLDPKEFIYFVAKNRNRAIMRSTVKCWVDPAKQKITREGQYANTSDHPSYESDFDNWNNGDGQSSC